MLLPALLLIPPLAGCAPFQSVVQPTPTPTDCRLARTCAIIMPVCGPAISSTPSPPAIYYYGVEMPRNVAQVAGFQPLVPTWIPTLAATWDSAALLGPPRAPGPAPTAAPGLRAVAIYAGWTPTALYRAAPERYIGAGRNS